MLLDLRTIYFIVAVSCFVLRILQLAAYATGRFERWPLWRGVSNLLVGVGSFLVALRELVPYRAHGEFRFGAVSHASFAFCFRDSLETYGCGTGKPCRSDRAARILSFSEMNEKP